jgi:hypothetical protein
MVKIVFHKLLNILIRVAADLSGHTIKLGLRVQGRSALPSLSG